MIKNVIIIISIAIGFICGVVVLLMPDRPVWGWGSVFAVGAIATIIGFITVRKL